MEEAAVGHGVEIGIIPAGFEHGHLRSCQLVHLVVDVLSQMGAGTSSELELGILIGVWCPVLVSIVDYS